MTRTTTPRQARHSRTTLALALGAALGLSGIGLAPVAQAATTPWAASFEAGETFQESQRFNPISSVAGYAPDANVTGRNVAARSLVAQGTTVTASAENGTNESAQKVIDGDITSKWLAPQTTAWLRFDLGGARTVERYVLTTANDAWTRNPRNWTFDGSVDGATWTTLDQQVDQLIKGDLSPEPFTKQQFTVPAAERADYRYYRLNLTANNGAPNIQLADVDLIGDGGPTPVTTSMHTAAGSGPTFSNTAKTGVGYHGTRALQYRVTQPAEGTARATNVLRDDLNITVGPATQLSYKIFPMLTGDNYDLASAHVTVDLLTTNAGGTDPRLLSNYSSLTDQYGFGIAPAAQAAAQTLWPDQWNSVRVDLSSLQGRVVKAALVHYHRPSAKIADLALGWIDDIAIADATPIDPASLTNYVDTRRGTNSSKEYSRGNTFPAALWPNGFNFFTPFTDGAAAHDAYSWQQHNTAANRPQLQGIGISHQPTRWGRDRTQLLVMPTLSTAGTPDASLTGRQLEFSHDNEVAQPDEYRVGFDNGITAKVAPTDHAGVFHFTFPAGASSAAVFVDRGYAPQSKIEIDGATVRGWIDDDSYIYGKTRMYFHGEFSRSPQAAGTASGRTSARYLRFDTSTVKTVEFRVATSFISLAQAQHNLNLEVLDKNWGYAEVQAAAEAAWEERLAVIDLSASTTATETDKVNVYSNLYKLNMYPNSQFENAGTAANPVYKYASPVTARTGSATDTHTNAEVRTGRLYVNNGFWDTYHTAWPLYSLLYPDVTADLVDGFVEQYRAGGWISRWSSPGYANSMTGTNSDAAFADAFARGAVPVSLAKEAYAAGLRNATVVPRSEETGRKVMSTAPYIGYTPADQDQSVSWTIEGALNDDALAAMAELLAADPGTSAAERRRYLDEAAYLHGRAADYVNIFDSRVGDEADAATPLGFFTARDRAGTFTQQPGDYRSSGNPSVYNPEDWDEGRAYNDTHFYTETNGWNFAFLARHDIDGLAALYGGTDGLVAKLDTFFATPERATTRKIHETYEARDVRLGQWGASNQVSFPIASLYAAAGKPSRTQAIMREAMSRLYVGSEIGQGFPGDEDNGAMASFQIFGALGFYPVRMGSGELVLGSPTFDEVTLHPHGTANSLTITAPANSATNIYVQSARLDGQPIGSATIAQSSLTTGNHTLDYTMGPNTSTWGERTSTRGATAVTRDLANTGDSVRESATGTAPTAVVTAPGVTGASRLFDDRSSTAATLPAGQSVVTVSLVGAARPISGYTITNSARSGASAPSSWRFEGSADGTTWSTLDTRTDEEFRWSHQLRPFSLTSGATGAHYRHFRFVFEVPAGVSDTEIGELQILNQDEAAAPVGLSAIARSGITATEGQSVSMPLATVTGAANGAAVSASLTVDGVPATAQVDSSSTHPVIRAADLALTAGVHDFRVSVTAGGQTASASGTIDVSRDETVAAAFARAAEIVCFAYPGTDADCDGNGWAVDRDKAADAGALLGQERSVTLGGAAFRFTLPSLRAGQPDTVIPAGQRIPVNLAPDTTQAALIGFANEGTRSTPVTLRFDDGTTSTHTVTFGDWVSAARNPIAGNTLALGLDGRVNQVRRDGARIGIFATDPISLPTGKRLTSIQLAPRFGSLKPEGQVHLLTLAENGSSASAIDLRPAAATDLTVIRGTQLSAALAQVSGGRGEYVASVNWGDGTGAAPATVDPATGGSGAARAVSGTHTFDRVGTYTAVITVSDDESSARTVRRIVVTAPTPQPPGPPGPVKPVAPAVGVPAASKRSQAHGSVARLRVRLTSVVTGATSGRVQFRSGSTALGSAPIIRSGNRYTATLLIPATAKVRTYRSLTAVMTVSGKRYTSPANKAGFRVVKARPKTARPRVTAKRFAAGSRPMITVRISSLTNGRVATGRVQVRVGKKTVRTVRLTKARKGKITIALPRRSSAVKVRARFVPAKAAAKTTRGGAWSKSVTVRTR